MTQIPDVGEDWSRTMDVTSKFKITKSKKNLNYI